MKRFILFITILLSTLQLFAQRENDIWYMGTGYGLKFDANNNTSYVPLMTMSQNGVVVCDSLGNLLFYSNGRIIKDKDHNIMPNSYTLHASDFDLYGNGSINTIYGVLRSDNYNMQVIQMDKAIPRYMFFYVNSNLSDVNEYFNPNTNTFYELRYSIIDMRLNGGKGDIDPNFKDVLIGRQFYAALCIIPSKCNAWLVAANKANDSFYSYPIMPDESIGDPVKSNSPYLDLIANIPRSLVKINNQTFIDLVASPKGNFITSAQQNGNNAIMRFNKMTGKVSHLFGFYNEFISQPKLDFHFRFSPDELKLYSQNDTGNLHQFDATLIHDSVQLMNSRNTLNRLNIHRAPFKIPNTYSTLYRKSYMNLSTLRVRNNEMYHHVMLMYVDSLNHSYRDYSSFYYKIINPDSLLIESNLEYVDTTNYNYMYHITTPLADSISGNHDQRVGRFTDFQSEISNIGRDMVIFQPNTDLDTVVTLDTVICSDVNMTLTTRYADATHIRWSTGSTDSSINIDATGRYTVTVTYPHCSFTEVFWVRSPLANISLSVNDTLMCTERPFVVYVNREGVGGRAVWQNGMIGDSMIINKGGTYHVTIKTDCGSVSDTLHVQEMSCRCSYFVPNAFTPNGDGLNDLLIVHIDCIPLEYQMHIYNRYGQLVNKLEKYGEYWDGTFIDKQPAASGVYFYRMRYKDLAGDYQTVTGDVTLLR